MPAIIRKIRSELLHLIAPFTIPACVVSPIHWSVPKIGETLWHVATYRSEWVALLSFSAAAWKCAVRDRWIGWDDRHQYKGYGPENITRLRPFAISIIKLKGARSTAQKTRDLNRNTRLVFDYLRMANNACVAAPA